MLCFKIKNKNWPVSHVSRKSKRDKPEIVGKTDARSYICEAYVAKRSACQAQEGVGVPQMAICGLGPYHFATVEILCFICCFCQSQSLFLFSMVG